MALVLADRVQELSTTTGTVDFALAGAVASFQTFDAAIGVTNTCYYAAVHSDASLDEWEIGVGTLSASTTLQRTTILSSSNSNSPVNFSVGAKSIFVTLPSQRAIYSDAAGVPPYPTIDDSVAISIVMG
jgi:hypothetical protein